MSERWIASVKLMRVLCPAAFLITVLLGAWSYAIGSNITAIVDAFLAGINLVLTWVQWQVFNVGEQDGPVR